MQKKIKDYIDKLLSEEEVLEGCFVIEIVYHESSNQLKVFLDADRGLTLDQCKRVNRSLETFLDESLLIGEKYSLEVSSPGLDRPLVLMRQYQKNIGRMIELVLVEEGEKIEGVLTAVSEEGIGLDVKKKKETHSMQIAFVDIKKALVKIKF